MTNKAVENLSASLVTRTAEYVKNRLQKEKTGHDWFHVYRVWQLAKYLQKYEGGNSEVVELAALLHSATEENYNKTSDEMFRSIAMQGLMDVLDIQNELKDKIIKISHFAHYKGKDSGRPKDTEGQIVQDANWLDGLGAIGVARVFTAGGYLGRRIYDPTLTPNENMSNEEFQKRKLTGTSVNYFYEKSFQVLPLLNTKTAQKIARKRAAFMRSYLDKFMSEWNLEDLE